MNAGNTERPGDNDIACVHVAARKARMQRRGNHPLDARYMLIDERKLVEHPVMVLFDVLDLLRNHAGRRDVLHVSVDRATRCFQVFVLALGCPARQQYVPRLHIRRDMERLVVLWFECARDRLI